MRTPLLSLALLLVVATTVNGQDWLTPVTTPRTVVLWPDGAPGAVGKEDQDVPTLTIYLPHARQATGAAIVICPGGGYGVHAMDHEGHQVARWLTSRGVTAAILKYRLGPRYHHPAMLQDALQAIRYVRVNAKDLHAQPDRIGILGFSAGGHLASTAATLFDEGNTAATAPMERASSRPDFAVLAYPVIAMNQPITHKGSQRNLLGEAPSADLLAKLSTEQQVTARTPPTFLFHTDADAGVPPENSVVFYLALRRAGVPAELHIYEKGPHGVGLAPAEPNLRTWGDRLLGWMEARGLFAK